MQNGVPGGAGARAVVCVRVFVSFVVVCAHRHLRPCLDIMSVHRFSVAQAAQAAEAVTNDYTYHPRAQEAGEKREGRGRGSGKAAERVEGRVEDENVCASVCWCA